MTIAHVIYVSEAIGYLLQVVTLVFLVWIYRSTQVKPVLYNVLWRIFNFVWQLFYKYIAEKAFIMVHGSAPTFNVYIFAASQLVGVTGTFFLIWMLVALMRWGRPRLFTSDNVASPSPAV